MAEYTYDKSLDYFSDSRKIRTALHPVEDKVTNFTVSSNYDQLVVTTTVDLSTQEQTNLQSNVDSLATLDEYPINPKCNQSQLIQPTLTSSYSTSSASGAGISYTATSNIQSPKWLLEDNDGTDVTVDYDTGDMSGGVSVPIGSYTMILRCANNFGVSDGFEIVWTVT